MRFTWHEAKRESNLRAHGLDFVDAREVFGGPTFTYEDDRFDYEKERFVTLGLCAALSYRSSTPKRLGESISSPFATRPSMSKRSSSRTSRTDWVRVRATKDKDIVVNAERPEASVKHIVRGIVRRGLKPVPPKASISLRVDADVLEWFKAQGPGYQTRINAVLRAFKEEAA